MRSQGFVTNLSSTRFFGATVVLLCLLVAGLTVKAQNPAQNPLVSTPTPAKTAASQTNVLTATNTPASGRAKDKRYRIGPGDVIEIRVLKAPELSRDSVRVDQDGKIRIPMFDDDVQAACMTEGELSKSIATLYLKYKRNPHVDVFVKEFQSEPVAVIGAVNAPAQFKLMRRVRLLELLTFAGGPAERAGRTVQVVHAGGSSVCEESSPGPAADGVDVASTLELFKLIDTMKGLGDANPVIRSGDIVSVPEAEQAYVVGNVLRPSAIPLKEPLTVMRAIAIAGGLGQDSKKDRIKIVRQAPGSTEKHEFYVNYTAIEKQKAEDVALQANDIVEVPSSGGKALLRSFVGTIAPVASQLPLRVVP
jgi:polysaccharide export outer membrane protein